MAASCATLLSTEGLHEARWQPLKPGLAAAPHCAGLVPDQRQVRSYVRLPRRDTRVCQGAVPGAAAPGLRKPPCKQQYGLLETPAGCLWLAVTSYYYCAGSFVPFGGVCCHTAMTPPLPPPPNAEQAKFAWRTGFLAGHDTITAEVQAADNGGGSDIIFWGDSLIERLRGTGSGG